MRSPRLLLLLLALVAVPAVATANPLGDLQRYSELPANGKGAAYDPQITFNGGTSEYLVSFPADAVFSDGEDEIYVQRVTAGGAQVGADTRISTIGAEGDRTKEPFGRAPAAADGVNDRYLVVWAADDTSDGRFEIFGQLLGAKGQEIGTDDLEISGPQDGALYPHVAFNPTDQEYLVVWAGTTTGDPTVWGRRVSKDGAPIGARFQISAGGVTLPQVAYNEAEEEYLVTWTTLVGAVDQEVWGQRVSATGAEIGTDFRLTTTGTDADDDKSVFASLSYNPLAGNYLLAWERITDDSAQEVYSQVLGATGTPQGTPTRLSAPGVRSSRAAVAYATAAAAGQYVVVWQQAGGGLFDREMWGRRVRFDGVPLAPAFQLFAAAGAFNSNPWVAARSDALEWLAVWSSDCPRGAGIPDQDTEVLGRRIGTGAPTGDGVCKLPGATPTPTPTPTATPAPTATPGTNPPPPPSSPPKLKAADVLTLPSTKKCVSRRKFRIRLRTPKGAKLAKVTVSLNGKLIRTVRGKRITATVNLRGLPKGRFKVKIQVTTADGRKVTGTRKYRTCVPRKKKT